MGSSYCDLQDICGYGDLVTNGQRVLTHFVSFICLCQVLGETGGSVLGRDLEALIQRAREFKKEYSDSFVSVEHLVLAFVRDDRFGRQLFKDFQISLTALKDAIKTIRGHQTVIDQGYNRSLFVINVYW